MISFIKNFLNITRVITAIDAQNVNGYLMKSFVQLIASDDLMNDETPKRISRRARQTFTSTFLLTIILAKPTGLLDVSRKGYKL